MLDIDDLLGKISIVEYISQYISLEKQGNDYVGVCAFHADVNPSFSVTEDNGTWFCFGCHKGGNLVSFTMKYHHVGYDQAIHLLCAYAGVEEGIIPQRLEATKTLRKFIHKDKKTKVATYKILPDDYMMRYELDWSKLKVWEDEGISRESMRKFQVRYCPFDNRIVFPIRTLSGGIMSVSGRTLDPDFKEKKIRKYTYFQSLGTLDTFYAYSDNLASINERREIIIFEGAKSVLLADTWGIYNTVAALTSCLSDHQVKTLINLGVRVVLAFDSEVNVYEDKNLPLLMRFLPVERVLNRDGLLKEKMSPVDAGKEVWMTLYERRKRLN